jgi:signal transduction histidine kinase
LISPFRNTYLRRLHAPASEGERVRVERVLGTIRVTMAALAIIAFIVDQPEPETYIPIIFTLLVLWFGHSVATLVYLHFRGISKRGVVYLHLLDIMVPALLSIFTHGPSTPLFSTFFFATVAASFRWGFYESVATSVFIVAWLTVETQFLTGSTKSYGQLLEGQYEINRLILHSSYLLALGYLSGRLGEDEKERRAESAVITRVLHAAYAQRSVSLILREIFGEFLRIFCASRACLVVQDLSSGRSYLFSLRNDELTMPRPGMLELSEEQASESMIPKMPGTFFASRSKRGITLYSRVDSVLRLEHVIDGSLPRLSIQPEGYNSLLSATQKFGHDWELRLILFDAQLGSPRELEFAESLFAQAITATHSVYLNHRMRSRAGAMERARVARELHDGVIQSMISAEIRLEVLKRQAEREQSKLSDGLNEVQDLLRKEVIELRELMRELKPTDLGPDQLLDHMADLVERFKRETGINARFICQQGEEVGLTPQTCRELMRIVQEGLVNVRRHAHASQVVISFTHDAVGWKLAITDNGRGFPFSGRLESETLMSSTKGPLVIKERVRNIGGTMTLESQPNQGSRLEVRLGPKGSSAHGE